MKTFLFSLLLFCPFLLSSQLMWDVVPANLTLECSDNDNDSVIEAYLNGLVATTSNCANDAILTWDYSDPGNFEDGDIIAIEITAIDECGVEADLIENISVTIEDTQKPILGVSAQNVYYDCASNATNQAQLDAWILNHAEATYSDFCSDDSELTWFNLPTNPLISDFASSCYAELIVTFWVEDQAGNSSNVTDAFFTLEDNGSPSWETDPSDLILNCPNPNNNNVVINWLAMNGYGIAVDSCTETSNLIFSNDYAGILPDCGDVEYVVFYVEDECGYTELALAEIIAIDTTAIVSFAENQSYSLESKGSSNVCLSIVNSDMIHPTIVTVDLQGSSLATNGLDFDMIPLTQDITIPANNMTDVCFEVVLIDDNDVEPIEFIDFEITNATTNGSPSYIVHPTFRFFIEDNDDNDNDGIGNLVDNCVDTYNPNQSDIDNDDIGDVCDSHIIVNELIETEDHIYVDKIQGGVIMKSPNGTCFLLNVDDDGSLVTTPVECP